MKKSSIILALLVVAGPFRASAQSTYTTTNGTVNLIAGLTNLTSVTAITTTNQATGISYITDSSWETTGVANIGVAGMTTNPIVGGTLAGTFGGGTYFAASNSIILIGLYPGPPQTPKWGAWTVRLLLSDDNYSSAIGFTDSDLSVNPDVTVNASWFQNADGTVQNFGILPTTYQLLNIGAFDTGNIGVKGIELSNFASQFPDISYIGVASAGAPGPSPVPEPGQVAASFLLLTGLGGYIWMKRRKTAKTATATA